jgi:hypothetical protein
LIAVFGLIPVAVQTNRNATSQTAATNVIAAVVADLRATPKCVGTSAQYQITFGTGSGCVLVSPQPKTLYFDGSGQFTTSPGANSRYQLNVTFFGSTGLRYADLKVTWPAGATAANASGSMETFAAFDRN